MIAHGGISHCLYGYSWLLIFDSFELTTTTSSFCLPVALPVFDELRTVSEYLDYIAYHFSCRCVSSIGRRTDKGFSLELSYQRMVSLSAKVSAQHGVE